MADSCANPNIDMSEHFLSIKSPSSKGARPFKLGMHIEDILLKKSAKFGVESSITDVTVSISVVLSKERGTTWPTGGAKSPLNSIKLYHYSDSLHIAWGPSTNHPPSDLPL